ncbi:peptide/nickel transport system permease protein [Faunimonas pinastri]|uniref:Peptide/nickel transport system permease protein n=1 Tax=Faunimonas pinastri TaxID=1855383 RepID=A0A1H9EM77_9HYPH|nr:peptide/nickel transport system permease protein [Faunimonas pinastri]
MTVETSTSIPLVDAHEIALEPVARQEGPWSRAWAKFRRDRTAVGAGVLLIVIVVASLLAPLYASQIAHTDPFRSGLSARILINGKRVPVMQPSTQGLGLGVTPIGPTWGARYLLGADTQGRDVAARLLYGGRNTLLIAGAATFLCFVFAAILGIVAGFFGGIVDLVISRVLDILWAFPVFLLAISLSIVLISQALVIGPFTIGAGSLALPIVIIGLVYVPYVARPVRGQVLTLKNSEFVLAAIGLGIPRWRILLKDILPNVSTTLIVFIPLMMALNIMTESALSFLSVGVQPPDASWGTIILDGESLLYTRPAVSLAPGLAIVITVLALNLLGDGVRDALDPRSKLRPR